MCRLEVTTSHEATEFKHPSVLLLLLCQFKGHSYDVVPDDGYKGLAFLSLGEEGYGM
jgi:hypothetical protein